MTPYTETGSLEHVTSVVGLLLTLSLVLFERRVALPPAFPVLGQTMTVLPESGSSVAMFSVH